MDSLQHSIIAIEKQDSYEDDISSFGLDQVVSGDSSPLALSKVSSIESSDAPTFDNSRATSVTSVFPSPYKSFNGSASCGVRVHDMQASFEYPILPHINNFPPNFCGGSQFEIMDSIPPFDSQMQQRGPHIGAGRSTHQSFNRYVLPPVGNVAPTFPCPPPPPGLGFPPQGGFPIPHRPGFAKLFPPPGLPTPPPEGFAIPQPPGLYLSPSFMTSPEVVPIYSVGNSLIAARPSVIPGYGPPLPPSPPPRKSIYDDEQRRRSIQDLWLTPIEDCDNTVIIYVASEGLKQDFVVHRNLLCYFSPYFRDIFQPKKDSVILQGSMDGDLVRDELHWAGDDEIAKFLKNDTRKVSIDMTVKIPDVPREITIDYDKLGPVNRRSFAAFLDWLYNGFEGFGLIDGRPKASCQTLVELWIVAGRIGVPACQDACIEGIEMWRRNTGIIQTCALADIYEMTKEYKHGECGLKKLLIDQCVWSLDMAWLKRATEEEFPRAATVDVLDRIRGLMNSSPKGRPVKPFEDLEERKKLYWVATERKPVAGVLKGWN